MNSAEIKELLLAQEGKLFGVEFVKKDKTIRRMSARLGVRKGVKGVVDRKAEDDRLNLLTVYDFNADKTDETQGGFRRVNLSTVRSVTIQGEKYSTGE